MMGSGKTTVGQALAERLGVPYVDNDDALVARTGRTAADIAAADGADRLHALEMEVLAATLSRGDRAVVSAPGSVALLPEAAALLEGHTVVWLRARPQTILERIRRDPERPLLATASVETVAALAEVREPVYRRLASLVVDVDGRSAAAVAGAIVAALPRTG